MGIYLKILAFTALVIGFAAFAPSDRACATSTIAPQTCDTEVWRTMASRARIETEREIMQNQNLIFKPDSILAYTCFDSMAAHAGAQAGVLFTHTGYWSPMPIQWGNNGRYVGMDIAVQNTAINAMRTYFTSNFNHSMLGGRGNVGGLSLPMHTATTTASQSSVYACSMMSDVWRVAKCFNFLHHRDFAVNDGFFPFINLQAADGGPGIEGYEAKNDVRAWPTACTGTPLAGSTWLLQYRQSRNETAFGSVDALYNFGTPLNTAFTDVRRRVGPVGSPGSTSCNNPPIPTGVQVILSPGTTTPPYADGVCTNPGCTFVRSGSNGSCSSAGTGALPAAPSTGVTTPTGASAPGGSV